MITPLLAKLISLISESISLDEYAILELSKSISRFV